MSIPAQRYPNTRPRRWRGHAWSRALVCETRLSPADLIWPLFLIEGQNERQPIASLPGIDRLSVDLAVAAAREARSLGIGCLALFPNTPADRRTDDGREALNPDNLVCRAIATLKAAVPEVGIMADVALDPYTSHGHDGLLNAQGRIANDQTVAVLVAQALVQARAGADILAPSDMMDGRVGAIRAALETDGFPDTLLIAYAAKYASAFYGPFRDAVGSGDRLQGDKKTYQMAIGNAREALLEVGLDLAEGADGIIIKPGLPYLDILKAVKDRFGAPTFAYQVSGEYAMIEAAARAGVLDADAAMLETLTACKRAGADGILTYFAPRAARLLLQR